MIVAVPFHAARVLVALLALLVVPSISVIWAPPAASAQGTDNCPAPADDDRVPSAGSEAAARSLAVTCGVEVEVLAKASETTKVLAQPSGEFVFESSSEPQWAQQGGSWVDVDTTLVVGADGRVRPVASTADVVFSSGGAGPFATMRGAGAEFSLGWPTPLPQGVVQGDTITYPDVYPDVDLVVRAERGGFSHLLVVGTAEAAQNPAVRETTYVLGGSAEVTVTEGGVTVTGPDGLLAAAPPASAWDSGTDPVGARDVDAFGRTGQESADGESSTVRGPGEAARVAPVEVRVSGDVLTVAADPAVLDSGNFPIFIDPTYDKKWARWAPVNDSNPDTRWTSGSSWPREVARVGSNYDDHGDLWRSIFYFDVSALVGKRLVYTTSVDAYLVHTGWCAGESIGIWQTSSIASNTPTWNGMASHWLHDGPVQTKTGKANAKCGQSANWLKFDHAGIGGHVQRHANNGATSITFGFRMASESGGHWAKFDPASVTLKATYQSRPTSPVAIRTAPGGGCAASPGPWITSRTPTLYGKASDGDGTVKVGFDINGPTNPADHLSAGTTSGAERGWTTPTLTEGDYNWRVKGVDEGDETGWTGYCYFRLDHTGPETPVVARTSGTPVVGQPVTLSFTSSDARSGMKQFAYGIGVDVQQTFKASTGTTTITFTPAAGRTVVYVWAQDNAGNYSARTAFDFFTGRITEAQSHGAWRFDGDGLDDSGRGRNLTIGSGLGYGTDRRGNAGAALALNGTGCAQTGSGVRTDAEYTVAGWARLTDKSDYRSLAAQAGVARSSFYLRYNGPSDRWQFTLSGSDAEAATFATITASTATPLGAWQHVAATMDPVAKVMRLYLDGRLAAEGAIPFTPWNAQGPLLVGCAGVIGSVWHQLIGGIDHVGVWQGLLSDAQIARAATELPAGLVGDWQLHTNGAEETGRSTDLVLPAGGGWADDQYGRTESAMVLDGTKCATSEASVLRTDESFTIATWVRLTAIGTGNQTVLGQDGVRVSGWFLGTRYSGGVPYWSLMMMAGDSETTHAQMILSSQAATADVGRWTHLAGVYDATSRQMVLYVNGVRAGSVAANQTPWRAGGAMTVGCAWYAGNHVDRVNGTVSGVKAWRGALTDAQVANVHGGNPGVRLEALWPLDGPASDTPTYLTDVSGNGRNLTINGPYAWTRDRGFGRDGALGLELAAGSCAQTTGPAVRTNASFTVSTWVVIDQTTGHRSVATQAAGPYPGFFLGYNSDANRWHFGMPSAASGTPTWHVAGSKQPPALGQWTHLAGVYDLAAGKVRLYVNGVLEGEANGPASPWMAPGPTLIGCNGDTAGGRWSPLGGVVDDVRFWTSTVDPDRIADLAAG